MPYVGVGAKIDDPLVGSKMLKVYGAMAASLVLIVAVTMLGHHHTHNPVILPQPETVNDVHRTISEALMENINGDNMKRVLRRLTQHPHLAGSDENKKVAYTIAQLWSSAGLEDVHTIPYEVLLSYPDFDKPNRVSILSSSGSVEWKSEGVSPVINKEEQSDKYAGHQWLAWSGNGTVRGEIVYCNRGSEKDFDNINKMGIDMRGKIAVMRYGDGFRGDKAHLAQERGAIGAIIFSDPSEVALEGLDQANVYPNKNWMPNEGVQRGSIMHGDGDPLSPLHPSKKDLFRKRTIAQAKKDGVIPTIPVLPVSYSTARRILTKMTGRPVPIDWQGGLNVTYKMGPGMVGDRTLQIDVHSTLQTKKIRNVIGYLRGADEPDRYVMLGNHFDAWVYGSMDPNSGTAILTEVVRAMMQTVNETTWRPARTLVFTSWDAEEYGLIGSTEFVEEFSEILDKRAIAYLNMDCIHGNMSIQVNTIPSMFDMAMTAAKRVANPLKTERQKGRVTLYDTWVETFPHKKARGLPNMPIPGGGSDHAPFLNYLGIPVVDFAFKNATIRDTYPLYHTMYETPFLNEHLLDTDNFSVHRATGQYWAELARMLVDSPVLPMNVTSLAVALRDDYLPQLRDALRPHKQIPDARNQLLNLANNIGDFVKMARSFEKTAEATKEAFAQNPYDQRHIGAINDRIMGVERCMVNPRGMPNSPHKRHVLFSVSDRNTYAGDNMAAVMDAVSDYASASSIDRAREIAWQISIIQRAVQCATNTLRDVI